MSVSAAYAFVRSGTGEYASREASAQTLAPKKGGTIKVATKADRIRLDASGSDWPNIWPSPYLAETTVRWGSQPRSRLVLPTVPASRPEDALRMGEPEMPLDRYVIQTPAPYFRVVRDPIDDRSWVETAIDERGSIPGEVDYVYERRAAFEASDRDPAHAAIRSEHSMRIVRHGTTTAANVHGRLESTSEAFHLHCDVVVIVDEAERFRRNWSRSFPRHLV
jgi:hypothetical protein